jgi:hypothetical protein
LGLSWVRVWLGIGIGDWGSILESAPHITKQLDPAHFQRRGRASDWPLGIEPLLGGGRGGARPGSHVPLVVASPHPRGRPGAF